MVQNDMSNKKVGKCIKASTCSLYNTPWPHSTQGTPTKPKESPSHTAHDTTSSTSPEPHTQQCIHTSQKSTGDGGAGLVKATSTNHLPGDLQLILDTHSTPTVTSGWTNNYKSKVLYTFYVTSYCEMDRWGNKWSWINHNGRKLQRILTPGEAYRAIFWPIPGL